MHQIKQDAQPHRVRLVDECLEVVRRAVPRGRGEEIADLIAERRIIRMLHDRHELHRVIAVLLDTRQNIAHELQIGSYAFFFRRHADVRLVNDRRHVLLRAEFLICPDEFLARIPDGGAEVVRLFILHHIGRVQRDAVFGSACARHRNFDLGTMLERPCAGNHDFPAAVAHRRHRVARSVPVVEFADQVHRRCARRPLAVDPAALHLVEAVVQMTAGEIRQRLTGGKQFFFALFKMAHPLVQVALKRAQIRVIFYDLERADLLLCFIAHQKSSSPYFCFLRLYPISSSFSTLLQRMQ